MKIKGLILLSFIFIYVSCDNSEPFVIDGHKIYTIYSKCGTIVLKGSSFSQSVMVACTFNGKYNVNTDSLKIKAFSNKDVITSIYFQLNNKKFTVKKIETKGGETLSFNFRLLSTVPYKRTKGTILLLPSNFIICESKPIITDTIQIQLKD